ncbi:MAG: hypothetical protein J5U19_03625 [Candidatus Methanoperedens sp.]|nr:hypothetical protein [Candidatus Methanoperedens sp.]MCE8427467.1 hypothetical protein [Candidatus Methanoperedens sp.]
MNIKTIEDLDRLEKVEQLINELRALAESGAIIVVEGKKDVDSLHSLGINGEIRQASQQPLIHFAESLSKSGKKIVLLTDWDEKGGMISKKIIMHLMPFGIAPDTDIRKRISILVKKRIKDIESLNNYVMKQRNKRLKLKYGF